MAKLTHSKPHWGGQWPCDCSLCQQRAEKPPCHYCWFRPGSTRDHVIPRSRGERGSTGYTIAACGPCNNKRGDVPYVIFAERCGVPHDEIMRTIRTAMRKYQELQELPPPARDVNALIRYKMMRKKRLRRVG